MVKYANLCKGIGAPLLLEMFLYHWTEESPRKGAFNGDLDCIGYRHNSTL